MKFSHLLLLAAGVPLLASAQTDRPMPPAADANAPVTPLQYQSVFADYVTAKEAPQSPDKVWVRANRAVLGEEGEASTPSGQPTASASEKTAKPEPMHGKHEHHGEHQ
ncbi:hypothetical protein [Massilia sp. TN1-12]|uniref:hypothetical protein n=1 Tax=Massilia paldalensis TaxID=3377675 RepID=UPI003850A2DF